MFDTETHWGRISRLLHWTTAIVIFFQLGTGVYFTYILTDIRTQFEWIQIHKSWGFVVFFLALLRVLWRLANRKKPALPDTMNGLEKAVAKAGHAGLYVLLFLIPITGWLMVTSSTLQESFRVKNEVFGLFELYDPFVPGDRGLSELFSGLHFWCVVALTALLAGHIGAALYHQFGKRDDVLRRMTIAAR